MLDLHLHRPRRVVEPAPVLQQVVLAVDVDREVARAYEELRHLGTEPGVHVTALVGVHRLEAEVVEERDPVVVADVEEEVDEVGMVLRAPARGADRVHHGEAEDVAVEAHRRGGVEGRERRVVHAADLVLQCHGTSVEAFYVVVNLSTSAS